MPPKILVRFPLQITSSVDGNRAIYTFRAFSHFYMEKWKNFRFFQLQICLDHISLVFQFFELIFFLNERCMYGEENMV